MFRLGNTSIKFRLYGLVILSAVGVTAVLSIASYLLLTYRVSGPVYKEIMQSKNLEVAAKPAILFISSPYITLQELETAVTARERERLLEKYRGFVEEYRSTRREWLRKLPEGDIRSRIEDDIDK